MTDKSTRKIVDLVLEPRKGWTLASLFIEHVTTTHLMENDPGVFDASDTHYRVQGTGHSYHDIMDFRNRMADLAVAPGAPGIELIYDQPPLVDDARLDADVRRVLRTIDNDRRFVDEKTGCLLSTSCIVDVVKQLHMRLPRT